MLLMQSRQRPNPGFDRRGMGLENLSNPFVLGGNGETHPDTLELFEKVDISQAKGGTGQDIHLELFFQKDFETLAG
jgi:hypothetical protein